MSEKVLGFKEHKYDTYDKRLDKLVPVVSLEWLEKEIETVKQQGSWKAFLEFAEEVKSKIRAGEK